jgi:hypothetical protein
MGLAMLLQPRTKNPHDWLKNIRPPRLGEAESVGGKLYRNVKENIYTQKLGMKI